MIDVKRSSRAVVSRAILALALLATGSVATADYESRQAWQARVPHADVIAEVAVLQELVASRAWDELAARVAAHRARATDRPELHEAVLERFARSVQPPASSVAREVDPLRALLQEFASIEPSALAGHPEGPHHGIPAFPIAAAAQGALHRWRIAEVEAAAMAALTIGDVAWFEARQKQVWSPVETQGLAQALARAQPGALRRSQPQLTRLWQARPELARTAAVAARRTLDPTPLRVVLAAGHDETVLPDLARADEGLEPTQAEAFWFDLAAVEAPAVRGVALGALAQRGISEPAIEALGDPDVGAAAALALAKSGEIDRLAAVLNQKAAARSRRQHAALGLKLEGSPRARAALAAAAAQDMALARDFERWLK